MEIVLGAKPVKADRIGFGRDCGVAVPRRAFAANRRAKKRTNRLNCEPWQEPVSSWLPLSVVLRFPP